MKGLSCVSTISEARGCEPPGRERVLKGEKNTENCLIFVFRCDIVSHRRKGGCYLKSDSIQQMLRKPASFNAFAYHLGELCPGGLYPHILPDAASSLHVISGFWLDLRSSVRQ